VEVSFEHRERHGLVEVLRERDDVCGRERIRGDEHAGVVQRSPLGFLREVAIEPGKHLRGGVLACGDGQRERTQRVAGERQRAIPATVLPKARRARGLLERVRRLERPLGELGQLRRLRRGDARRLLGRRALRESREQRLDLGARKRREARFELRAKIDVHRLLGGVIEKRVRRLRRRTLRRRAAVPSAAPWRASGAAWSVGSAGG
jgi:hypothetical protein